MIETLVTIYFAIGLLMGLLYTFIVFHKDFDSFCEEQDGVTISTRAKLEGLFLAILLWPKDLIGMLNGR